MTADWLRAPQEDEAVVARPDWDQVGDLLAENRRRSDSASCSILGQPLAALRTQARQEAVAAAHDYSRQSAEPLPAATGTGLILAGHQPELFHPGVWVKNFALQGLARRHGLTPINLVVDNDTVKSTAIRVPQNNHAVHLGSFAFDRTTGEAPYEEQLVGDEPLFSSFPDRVSQSLLPWHYAPMLPQFWEEVRKQSSRTRLLGERFAASRRALERDWGCSNLELPVSRLSQTGAFAWFSCHLLADLPRFHEVYNGSLGDYRKQHGIRSRNHPVPELTRDGDWWETPFWGWRAGKGKRGRLFARPGGNFEISLRVGSEEWRGIKQEGPATESVAGWRGLEALGFKARPRALTLTLFARLFLADLFIHGIGGGKYDLLTDEIIRRFYGIEPPGFLVLSATLHLPLPAYPATADDRRRLVRELRDLRWNPQRHLDDPSLRPLIEDKLRWIAFQPTNAQERRERFVQIRRISEQLQNHLTKHRESVRSQREQCDRALAANAVLRRRDYAFCLYPEEKLRRFMTRFLEL